MSCSPTQAGCSRPAGISWKISKHLPHFLGGDWLQGRRVNNHAGYGISFIDSFYPFFFRKQGGAQVVAYGHAPFMRILAQDIHLFVGEFYGCGDHGVVSH